VSNYDDAIRASSTALDLPNLLKQPTRCLLGVSQPAADALSAVGIHTVFDLGASNLFASARSIIAASHAGTPDARFGLVAGDLITDDAATTPLGDVPNLPLSALRLLTAAQAQQLTSALDVETIRDLASWPPQIAARRIMGEMAGGTGEPDDLQAEELRPRFGQYPTERVYYSTLTMLQMLGQPPQLLDLTGAVSLKPAVDNPGGLNQLAIGAFLTFEQSWFAQGITLGHLLHSLSLAPGEATRVAVIDWSRRTSAFASENIEEAEQLDSATMHSRALSEVQQAVAQDFQEGGSSSSSSATSTSHAETSAGSSGLLTSLFSSGSGSTTDQNATTTAEAESSSWSLGNRSVLGTMTQNVNDRTEQHSTSVRNRRATAVREVSQTEHEQVSTRIVANYNHMHALTVQYYEVVQLYRVRAALHRADRCLFVPMELLDFSPPAGIAVVERFRGALIRAALNARVRSLLADDTTSVQIDPVVKTRFGGLRPDLAGISVMVTAPRIMTAPAPPADTTTPAAPTAPPETAARVRIWDDSAVARVSRLLGIGLVRSGSDSLHVPDDTELLAVSFDAVVIKSVRLDQVGGTSPSQTFTVPADSGMVDIPGNIRLVELDAINVSKAADPAAKGTMTLHCAYLGRRFALPAIPLDLSAGIAPQKVAAFTTDQADRRKELLADLQSQREYYSHAIFRSLDAATLTLILGQFKWNGRPLIEQVEPRPVTVAGNYLVLRAPVDATEHSGITSNGQPLNWGDLLEQRGLPLGRAMDERLIPMATGGVFAEAVLGRSNSAEKLDITRFWHWEDSPIPLVPTEIAPISTGSRATAEDLTPGQLSAPVLNIVNPTNLPDPTGIGAAFNALATMNFRDMSGLAGTQGLVKAASEGTLDAATEAGRLASENMKTEAQKAVAMGQIAADVAKAAIAASANSKAKDPKTAMAGISRDGAMMNKGKQMDAEAAQGRSTSGSNTTPGSSDDSSATGDSADNGGGGGGGSDSIAGGGPAVTTASREGDAFDVANFGPLGESGGGVIRDTLGLLGTPKPTKPTTPAKKLRNDELYGHGDVPIPADWSTESNEIAAMSTPFWKPGNRDFDALAKSIVIDSNVKTAGNLRSFFNVIPMGVKRTNFYSYVFDPDTLLLTVEINPQGGLGGNIDPPDKLLTNRAITTAVLQQLKVALQNADPNSSFAMTFNEIMDAAQNNPDRELWLYTVNDVLSDALGQAIANTFKTRTFVMQEKLWFFPDTSKSPVDRVHIGVGPDESTARGVMTTDPYTFDKKGKKFDPQP